MEYEVANGKTLPNLGERACIMWADGAALERQNSYVLLHEWADPYWPRFPYF